MSKIVVTNAGSRKTSMPSDAKNPSRRQVGRGVDHTLMTHFSLYHSIFESWVRKE